MFIAGVAFENWLPSGWNRSVTHLPFILHIECVQWFLIMASVFTKYCKFWGYKEHLSINCHFYRGKGRTLGSNQKKSLYKRGWIEVYSILIILSRKKENAAAEWHLMGPLCLTLHGHMMSPATPLPLAPLSQGHFNPCYHRNHVALLHGGVWTVCVCTCEKEIFQFQADHRY